MSDIAAPDVRLWQRLEEIARATLARYGFEELRTPIVEFESVFTRSIGSTTDVVQKEMYVFEKGGRRLALRPEGTAGSCATRRGWGRWRRRGRAGFISGRCSAANARRRGGVGSFISAGSSVWSRPPRWWMRRFSLCRWICCGRGGWANAKCG